MSCKEICLRYKFDEGFRNWGKYEDGIKRCNFCDKYLELSGKTCPCCKNILQPEIKKLTKKNQIHQNFIYKRFRLRLNLSLSVVEMAKNYEEDLMKRVDFDIPPHVMATSCIYMITKVAQPTKLEEILDVFNVSKIELRHCLETICKNLPQSKLN